MSKDYFCLSCRSRFDNEPDWDAHPCNPIFKMIDGRLTVEVSEALQMKRTRWGRFKDRLFELDISFGLAVIGLIIVNFILIRHVNLNFVESFFEGLGIGFAIPRLIK